MTTVETTDYLPYGFISIEPPQFDEKSSKDIADFFDELKPESDLNIFNLYMENIIKTAVGSVYRDFFAGRLSDIREIKVDKNGTANVILDDTATVFVERKYPSHLYNLIYELLDFILELGGNMKYLKPHAIKLSRYLWNANSQKINTPEVMNKVLKTLQIYI